MQIQTSRSGLTTTLSTHDGNFTLELPRGGVFEMLPGRNDGQNRILVRNQGGAVLSEHVLSDNS